MREKSVMIRKAEVKDIPRMMALLSQVDLVHHEGRPDLFRIGTKYSEEQLEEILRDPKRPILAWTDGEDVMQGYCFCIYQQHVDDPILTDIKTLYIDDLCVDESQRGKGIGSALYEAALALARETDCYNVTLNVWSCNESAMRFYQSCGLAPQKVGMEIIL